jgi:hypothetical protein
MRDSIESYHRIHSPGVLSIQQERDLHLVLDLADAMNARSGGGAGDYVIHILLARLG